MGCCFFWVVVIVVISIIVISISIISVERGRYSHHWEEQEIVKKKERNHAVFRYELVLTYTFLIDASTYDMVQGIKWNKHTAIDVITAQTQQSVRLDGVTTAVNVSVSCYQVLVKNMK